MPISQHPRSSVRQIPKNVSRVDARARAPQPRRPPSVVLLRRPPPSSVSTPRTIKLINSLCNLGITHARRASSSVIYTPNGFTAVASSTPRRRRRRRRPRAPTPPTRARARSRRDATAPSRDVRRVAHHRIVRVRFYPTRRRRRRRRRRQVARDRRPRRVRRHARVVVARVTTTDRWRVGTANDDANARHATDRTSSRVKEIRR